MNLYDLHKTPESLHRHDDIDTHVAEAFWNKYEFNPSELKKREVAISKNTHYSYLYARDVINRRFEIGEPAIAKDSVYSCLYAKNVLNGRFELGEPAIAKSMWNSLKYAQEVIKGRFELGEPAIAKDLACSYTYAIEVLKGRFELGEKIIATSTNTLRHYNNRFKLNIEPIR